MQKKSGDTTLVTKKINIFLKYLMHHLHYVQIFEKFI